MKFIHHEKMKYLIARAIDGGATQHTDHMTTFKWEISGDCLSPYSKLISSRSDKFSDFLQGVSRKGILRINLEILTRCRACDNCKKQRSKLWFARARNEIEASPRTWFGTLTLTFENQMYFLNRARLALHDFELKSDDLQFKALCKEISPEITKYLKRVRKLSGGRLRFCLISEAHKSGFPHFHLLVHQVTIDGQVTYRNLSSPVWCLGFTNFKLVESTRAASYVSKYLSKSLRSKIRASIKYGNYVYNK